MIHSVHNERAKTGSSAFFADKEGADLPPAVRILPIRQEQLQERLGERFRELDIPLLIEWPDGRREAILFVLEEECEPQRRRVGLLLQRVFAKQ